MIDTKRKLCRAWALPLLFASLVSGAESLTCEYFVNEDPGLSRAVEAGECDIVNGNVSFRLDTSRLVEGFNLVGVRVCNGGHWSVTHTEVVWKLQDATPEITAAEYFWDTDPGLNNATAIAGADNGKGWLDIPVPATALPNGAHLLGVRVRTASGWSATHTNLVHIHSGEMTDIVGVEYFWGTDPGEGEGTAVYITPAPTIELENLAIPFPADDCDEYTLSVRGKTTRGWGNTVSWTRKNTPASSITLSDSELEMEQGTTHLLQAEVAPDNTLFKNLLWSSSNPDIVTVDASGMLTAIRVGEATISAKTERYANVENSCKVSVTDSGAGIYGPVAADVTVSSIAGGVEIGGSGAASVRVVGVDGIIVAALQTALPATVSLTPAIYVVTVNGVSYKVVVE